MNVKRYDCTNGKAQHCYGCYEMTEAAEGDYVSSAEFDRVSAERDDLQQRLTVQDQKVDDLKWVLMAIRSRSIDTILIAQIDEALKPTAESEPASDRGHCKSCAMEYAAASHPTCPLCNRTTETGDLWPLSVAP